MIGFIRLLQDSKYAKKEAPLKVKDVILTQKELVGKEYPFLPIPFLHFLKIYNGVLGADSAILGIPPLNNDRLDIVKFNHQFNQSPDFVILGYDDSCFLVYHYVQQEYLLVDREGGMVLEEYQEDELEYALNSILHMEND